MKRHSFRSVLLIAFGILFTIHAPRMTIAATIQALGDLPGGTTISQAHAVSADGSTVVGYSSSGRGIEAFRWTQATGMIGLGDLPGGAFRSNAHAVSADGSVVVGESIGAQGEEAFRWTQATGMVGLGDLSGASFSSHGYGVSGNGDIVVGVGSSSPDYDEGFRWTADTGMVSLGRGDARAISEDGATIVGYQNGAYRWTQETGVTILNPNAEAEAVSGDGTVIVGGRSRWTAQGETDLGFLGTYVNPDGSEVTSADALGVSADGKVIVGRGTAGEHESERAFIWDPAHRMRKLEDVLAQEHHLSMSRWTLFSATGISADGKTIVGEGVNAGDSTGWIVSIPDLFVPDAGDIDMDGDVDLFDVAVLQAKYCGAGQWAAGDFNADDRVDIFDVAMMQVNFGRGVVTPPAAVPEPASAVLLAIGAGVVLAGWRFRRLRSRHALASCRCATQTLSR